MSAATKPAGRRLFGILLMCLAVSTFAISDAMAKWLGAHINVFMVVWARYVVHFVIALVVFNPWTVPGLLSTRRPVLQVTRSALLFGCTILNFTALQFLQLDQTVSIMFSAPFFVALFAGPMLGEWVGARHWAAISAGFAGILLVAQPGAGGIHPAALLSLFSAGCYALYAILTRMLADTDKTPTTLFYTSLVGSVVASLPLPFAWETPQEPAVLVVLLLIGLVAGGGHMLLIIAHRHAPAAVLAPFLYVQIIGMIILGWALFHQVPSLWTLAGSAIVIASGVYLLLNERRERARETLEATLGD
ncbi:DMT family transporter [Azorhizobium caulinodans]|uniref:DMT family transporter n=1 Tax=Azorhizobium caulinodans TaxID=7 RepID=UPI002FBDE7EC